MRLKGKNAISLIVLVITILVLSILAATVIISLNNTNVINQASSGVDKYNKKQYEEKLNMAYANWLLDNVGATFDEENISDLGSYDFDASELPSEYKVTVKNNVPQLIEVDIWDGVSVATSFSSGTGTKKDPYIIKTAAELAYLSKAVNDGTLTEYKYYELVSNIDLNNMSWTPIGTGDNYFLGSFNGNNNTIYNLNVRSNRAAFICNFGEQMPSGNTAVLTNLSIEGGSVVGTEKAACFVVNASGVRISNCHNIGVAVKTDLSEYTVAGIVHSVLMGNVYSCSNFGSVASAEAAGIAYMCSSASIEKCVNYGKVSGLGTAAGILVKSTSAEDCTNKCINYGKVEGVSRSAGITLVEYDGYNNDCYNYGTVTGGTIYTYDEAQ